VAHLVKPLELAGMTTMKQVNEKQRRVPEAAGPLEGANSMKKQHVEQHVDGQQR
jgi:hypothetical protein